MKRPVGDGREVAGTHNEPRVGLGSGRRAVRDRVGIAVVAVGVRIDRHGEQTYVVDIALAQFGRELYSDLRTRGMAVVVTNSQRQTDQQVTLGRVAMAVTPLLTVIDHQHELLISLDGIVTDDLQLLDVARATVLVTLFLQPHDDRAVEHITAGVTTGANPSIIGIPRAVQPVWIADGLVGCSEIPTSRNTGNGHRDKRLAVDIRLEDHERGERDALLSRNLRRRENGQRSRAHHQTTGRPAAERNAEHGRHDATTIRCARPEPATRTEPHLQAPR